MKNLTAESSVQVAILLKFTAYTIHVSLHANVLTVDYHGHVKYFMNDHTPLCEHPFIDVIPT